MSGPGQYRDFNKTASDLLTKVFPKKTGANQWAVELELKPTRYQSLSGKIVNLGGVSTGEASSEVVLSDFGVTFKGMFRTDKPTLEASWKMSDKIPVDGLSAKVHFDAAAKKQTAGVSLAYVHDWATFNTRIHVPVSTPILDFAKDIANQDTKLDVDMTFRHPDHKFVLGASSKVSFPQAGDRRVDEANVALAFRDGKAFSPSINYSQKAQEGKEDARAVSVVVASQPADTQYVVQVDYELGSKKTVATAGLSYPLADGAVVKAKLNSDKQAGLGYSNQISSSTKLDFGTLMQLNTEKSVAIDTAFNFNLKFVQ